MPKRKLQEDSADGANAGTVDPRKQRCVLYAYNQGAHQLAQAFKLAKGFERQKLGRRRKDAEKEKDYRGMRKIDAEIAALKTLNATTTAKQYISKNLLKIKSVASDHNLPSEIREAVPSSTDDAAVLNVTARICSSNPVRSAFPGAMREVKAELGLEVEEQPLGKKRRLRAKDFAGEQDTAREDASIDGHSTRSGVSTDADGVHTTAVESSNVSHDEDGLDELDGVLNQFRHRLASSEDEDEAISETSNLEDLERQLELEGISRVSRSQRKQSHNHTTDLSLSDDASESESESPAIERVTAPKKSAFVPSLTLGGYIPGNGSDIDDDIDVAPRKNRRGQRARQKIWEQKYGGKASHLQKQDRSKGWDPKRGATNGGVHGRRDTKPGVGGRSNFTDRTHNTAKPRRDDSGPLHPSWEAAKKAKEKKSAPVAFQGKKISFD